MSKTITDIRKDTGEYEPTPPIYTFTFKDGFKIALSKNTADKHLKYDGKEFSVWETKDDYVKSNEEISAETLPEKIEVDELYVDDESITEAHLEAIASQV